MGASERSLLRLNRKMLLVLVFSVRKNTNKEKKIEILRKKNGSEKALQQVILTSQLRLPFVSLSKALYVPDFQDPLTTNEQRFCIESVNVMIFFGSSIIGRKRQMIKAALNLKNTKLSFKISDAKCSKLRMRRYKK